MLNRVDRKRPSAVLEDRLEIDNIVDLDSSALNYLQLGAIHAEKWKEYLVGKVSWHSDQLRPNGVCCKDGDEYIINSVCCNHDDQYSIYIHKMTQ